MLELRLLQALCSDNTAQDQPNAQSNPMVKSAAAARLGDMLQAMADGGDSSEAYISSEDTHGCNLSKLYIDLLHDDHDYVKVAAVRSSAAIFKYWPLTKDADTPGAQLVKCAHDKSWRVRVAVAEVLGDVAQHKPSAAAKEVCKMLMNDPEAEVVYPTATPTEH